MTKGNIDVITEDLSEHPHCAHGPTLLFSREVKGKQRHFFACSACRDRKQCTFFLWKDEKSKLTTSKKNFWAQEISRYLKNINHRKMYITLNQILALPAHQRIYCRECSLFILDKDKDRHKHHDIVHHDHNMIQGLTDYQLNHPSEILLPAQNAKKEAQYLFAKSSVETITNIFVHLGYKNVICIGTPRIHEYIRSNCKNMNSLLLDIDKRFHTFFGPLEYIWYNSFNHHFFFNQTKHVFTDFLTSNKGNDLVLITDPPFGGRVEPLAFTLTRINNEYKYRNQTENDLPMFWIFPYFMEPQIVNSLPRFKMLDYKVNYDNHSSFQNGPKGRKQGSPVRIFTNVDPKLIILPEDEYRLCVLCNRWVSRENRHCSSCNDCTSKDGRTYVHCSICRRCVKPTWKHCSKCNRCAQAEHKCVTLKFSKECFYCKGRGHKKAECPQINSLPGKNRQMTKKGQLRKRKSTE